jgi:hypothetical protein
VIFYTLQGPGFQLEIHDDRLKLIRKSWARILAPKAEVTDWKLAELEHFTIATPKFLWGRIEWSTFDGSKGSFRFTTNAQMMGKIERYLNKLIIKNLNRRQTQSTQGPKELKEAFTSHLKAA